MNLQRRYDLDWVRIGAFLLLILYHVGMYYVTWDFHVKSAHAADTIEPLMLLSSPWRLSLLFLVSGVATRYLLMLRPARFLRTRSVRLLVPLLFGMLVIVPPQSYLEVVEKLGYAGGFGEFWRLYITGFHGFCRGSDCLILPTWNHLWFVAYLWVYTVILFAGARLHDAVVQNRWGGLETRLERHLSGAQILIWPMVYLALARLMLAPRFPQTHALVDDWYCHAVYLFFFLFGFALARMRAPWETIQQARWPALGAAVLSWAYLCAYYGIYSDPSAVPPAALIVVGRIVYAADQWLAIVAVLGFARRHWGHDGEARRYLTSAIFPVYILHQTVIIVAAHALKPASLYPPVEGLMLVMVTLAACFLGYELIRRVPLLRPLFGLAFAPAVLPTRAAPGARAAQPAGPGQVPPRDLAGSP
jgi:surface polysaccharide O-acyltransferase-like enzyme